MTTTDPIISEDGDIPISSQYAPIEVSNDLNAIPTDKNHDLLYNYNSGLVGIRCVVNSYCPVFRKPVVNNTMILNDQTIKAFDNKDISNTFSGVPGLPGIYLREIYKRFSNFLEIDKNSISNEYKELEENSPYRCEQTFEIIPSVFDDPDTFSPVDQSTAINSLSDTGGRAVFGYTRFNDPVNGNTNEASDSNVLYISQKASASSNDKGIHWRVRKKTPLFSGEDFFIVFRRNAVATDSKNLDTIPFLDDKYLCLDVTREPSSTDTVPENLGVVNYTFEGNINSNEIPTNWQIVPESQEYLNFASQSYYVVEIGPNPYVDEHIYFIFTQKSKPICVMSKEGKSIRLGTYEKIDGKTLIDMPIWVMSVRNHLGNIVVNFNGDLDNPWIINPPSKTSLKLIGFTEDKESDVEPQYILTKADDIIKVPASKLSIWGGNISSSFCFSPLTYIARGQLNLPPDPKTNATAIFKVTSGNKVVPNVPSYELPLENTKAAFVLASSTDIDLDTGEITWVPKGATSSDDDSVPLFVFDAQELTETKFTVYQSGSEKTDGDGNITSRIAPEINSETVISSIGHNTYYMTLGEYLKATLDYNDTQSSPNDSESYVPSSIKLDVPEDSIRISDDNPNVFNFKVRLTMASGNHDFPNCDEALASESNSNTSEASSETNENGDPVESSNNSVGNSSAPVWTLENCKTPVLPQFRLVAIPEKIPMWDAEDPEFDVSPLVMKYSESYSSEDFHTITHNGSITFLLNKGISGYDDVRKKLESMVNRAFYIDFSAGYFTCNYSKYEPTLAYKLFTGICYGGVINEQAGERTMTCQIFDYSKILQESYVTNSPFFDGMKDWSAIHELISFAGFRDDLDSNGNYGPAYLSKIQSKSSTDTFETSTLDGRGSYSTLYALPSSYDRLRSAFFKFQDFTPIWSAMQKICQKAGKVIFFDTYGMFHYENLTFDKYLFDSTTDGSDIIPLWKYTRYPYGNGQLIFDTLVRERAAGDVYNSIFGMTSNPERELIMESQTNWDSLYEKDKSGFLGYLKVFVQQEGIFGSAEALHKLIEHYKKFWVAPVVYKWQSYGLPVRANDVVEIDGQKLIITSVSTEIDASKNVWWQNLEGEWYGSEETLEDPIFLTNNP